MRGGGGSSGRGSRGTSRGRGSGRGRGRGTSQNKGSRDHGQNSIDRTDGPRFGAYKPVEKTTEGYIEDENGDEDAEDEFDVLSAAPMAYNALVTLMQPSEEGGNLPRKKRKIQQRKTQDTAAEDNFEDKLDESDDEQEELADLSQHVNDEEAAGASWDPFITHFDAPDPSVLNDLIAAIQAGRWQTSKIDTPNGGAVLQTLQGTKSLPSPEFLQTKVADLPVKTRLQEAAVAMIDNIPAVALPKCQEFMTKSFSYHDVIMLVPHYKEVDCMRSVYSVHCLNHVFKTRDRILKHDAKLSSQAAADVDYPDQGFTRPKVLILLPTRNTCLKVVDEIIKLSGAEQIENHKRFNEQFGKEGIDPLKNANKPDDFKAMFAGNTDDAFRIGIKFTRKAVKLFAQFYSSDIIIASPLGLRMAIGDIGTKKFDADYLSSIEVVVIDSATALSMQNWEHVNFCLEHLNHFPRQYSNWHTGRVRAWALEGQYKYLRQTIVTSSYDFPELRALFANLQNVQGRYRNKLVYRGAIMDIGIGIRQVYQRFVSDTPSDDPDARFSYFNSTLLPRIKKLVHAGEAGAGCLLFVPSYFDFVRVRNHFTSLDLAFEAISEYSKSSELTRSRQFFAVGRVPILIMTERLHHYRRSEIKGVKNVFFYQLPEDAQYFTELVRFAVVPGQAQAEGEVRIGFSKWDVGRLERVVGTKRVGKMISGKDTIFEFV